MEGTRFAGVNNVPLVEEVVVSQLITEETTTDVNFFAADDDNLLARENLFRNDGRKATQEMALAIDNDGGGGECRYSSGGRCSVIVSFV